MARSRPGRAVDEMLAVPFFLQIVCSLGSLLSGSRRPLWSADGTQGAFRGNSPRATGRACSPRIQRSRRGLPYPARMNADASLEDEVGISLARLGRKPRLLQFPLVGLAGQTRVSLMRSRHLGDMQHERVRSARLAQPRRQRARLRSSPPSRQLGRLNQAPVSDRRSPPRGSDGGVLRRPCKELRLRHPSRRNASRSR